MRNLKCKTRLNVSPNRKQKVYFCSHRDDFGKYFEKISDEILSFRDCAIWYKADYNAEYDEDFFVELKQMNLFVIPVTSKFICEKNDALGIEFRFAQENHIPVLPLMQESDLEGIFNAVCGDLQFLDKFADDPTALGYSKKLEEYLEAVLVGNELAEKVRGEFDAYIFLSYRKKDRKYAQELMSAIHKDDVCRDIAIWYDEFLVPGEDFNDSIKSAIDKSSAFVIAVTPNIVNEDNYITSTEYPYAKKQKKNIIPVEVMPTDRKLLKKKYKKISECIDSADEKLSKNIFESIKKAVVREHNNSPEHRYYIGVAYLNGVDVEIDYDKAKGLIISSAEEGFVEAVKKITDMHIRGVGTERNFERAVQWQKRCVELLKNEYLGNGKEESGIRWLKEMFSLAEMYREFGKNSDSAEILSECFSECEKLASLNENEDIFYLIISVCDRLYGIYIKEGDTVSAGKMLGQMASVYGDAVKKNVSGRQLLEAEYFLALTEEMIKLSVDGCEKEKNTEPSERLKISEKIYEQYGEGAARLASDYVSYAGELYRTGMVERAEKYFSEALTLREQIVKEDPSAHNIRKLGEIYLKLAGLYGKKKDASKAKAVAFKATELYERLSADTCSPEDYAQVRDLYFRFTAMGFVAENDEKIKSLFIKEIVRRKEVRIYTEDVGEFCRLYRLFNSSGMFLERKGCVQEAEEYYTQALLLAQKAESHRHFSERLNFIDESLSCFGSGYTAEEELPSAQKYYCRTLSVRKGYSQVECSKEIYDRLYYDYMKAGRYIFGEKEPLKKAEYLSTALEIDLKELNGRNMKKVIVDQLECGVYTVFEEISKIYESEKQYAKAKEYLLVYEKFLEENNYRNKTELLSELIYERAKISKKSGDYAAAAECYITALGDSEKTADSLTYEESVLWKKVYSELADCYNKMNDREKACKSYETLSDICMQKIKSYGKSHIFDYDAKEDAENYFDYAVARIFLAEFSEKETKKQLLEEARKILNLYKGDAGNMEILFDAYIKLAEQKLEKAEG